MVPGGLLEAADAGGAQGALREFAEEGFGATRDWDNLVGRAVASTGICAARDDDGNLIPDFASAPTLNHAMTSVTLGGRRGSPSAINMPARTRTPLNMNRVHGLLTTEIM